MSTLVRSIAEFAGYQHRDEIRERYQPWPLTAMILHDRGTTTIMRTWRKEDVSACRLCRCGCAAGPAGGKSDVGGLAVCMISVPGHIERKDAAFTRI